MSIECEGDPRASVSARSVTSDECQRTLIVFYCSRRRSMTPMVDPLPTAASRFGGFFGKSSSLANAGEKSEGIFYG